MSEPAPNQFALLGTRRFLPLFIVQFLGAFNDQVYQKAFVALVTYRLADEVGIPVAQLGVIASALFILPFAIITPSAGQLADRYDKAVLMRWIKAWEIVVMGLAVIGYYTQNIYFLYFVLFLMGAQSAMFAPIKYSVLPQYLAPKELMGGNGLVQGFTFLAIIFGTILGNELILREAGEVIDLLIISVTLPMDGVAIISTSVVAIAIVGFIAALFTPPAKPVLVNPPPVDWVFPRAIYALYAMCRQNKPAIRAILAISWFWFLGATFLSLLPAYAKEDLGVDESVLTVLLAGFSIGVAVGAVASEGLSRGRVDVNLPPIGALGLAVMAIELYMATPSLPFPPAPGADLADRAIFLDNAVGWRILIDFVVLAAFAGMYVTPLNAVLQAEAPDDQRASYIACSNVTDASFMVISAAIVAILVTFGVGTTEVLVIVTLTALPMAFLVARYAPETRLGRYALALWPRGPQ
ncbi:MAG: MFS transporter [Pseudomonadota bacterium]